MKSNQKYNHCANCHQWLGYINWCKFWQKPQLCEQCEAEKWDSF